MGFYALGNLASALSPDYHAMLLFRFIAGLPHGAYFGVAALVAASISPPGQSGRAVGLVMLGLSIALLVGNPLATWLGQVLRSEARRVGKECGGTCGSRWSPCHLTKQ